MGNRPKTGNILSAAVGTFGNRLPADWEVVLTRGTGPGHLGLDGVLKIRGPGRVTGLLGVQVKDRLEPKDVDLLGPALRPSADQPVLIAAPFLSPRTRERLKDRGFAYADLTGNVRLNLSKPGLFIDVIGAQENPEPKIGKPSSRGPRVVQSRASTGRRSFGVGRRNTHRSGALLTPFDDVVYDRTSKTGGITIAALSQVAADLSTSPGRGPNEAEALIDWMREHEDTWRA